jgi:peptide/nickel transport system substrate-binding protein
MKTRALTATSARAAGCTWRRRSLGRGAAGGLLGLGVAGVPLRVAAQPVAGAELKVAAHLIFRGLDPVHELTCWYLRGVGAAEGLFMIDADGEVRPELAQTSELVDPVTWLVGLRPGAAFWSGRPADARAVTESLERSRQLAPAAAGLLRGVRVEPADEWTVRFRSEAPNPGLMLNLADSWLVIHNAAAYGDAPNAFDLGAADLTGYYRIVAFEPQERALLRRNEGYWGVRPRMDRVRFEEVGDEDARTLVALSGEADIVRLLSPAAAPQVERSRAMRLVTAPNTSCRSAYLNIQKPPFDDVRVRQALAWAVDREEVVALAFGGRGTPYPSWLAAHPAFPEAKKVGYTRQDLAKAGQLLDEAGWRLPPGGGVRVKDGTPLRFRLYWFEELRPYAEVLQAQWRRAGAEVDVQGAADYGFLSSRRAAGDWDAFIEEWNTIGDPAAVLGRHVGADGPLNYMAFRDAGIDALLDGFAALLDAEDRRQQALKVNERQAALVPFIPLAGPARLTAVGRGVRNYVPHFLSWGPFEVHPDLWVGA